MSHEASRSGAPAIAARVLDALALPGTTRILIHRWGGPFRASMDAHAEVAHLETLAHLRVLARRWRMTRPLAVGLESWAAGRVLDRHRPTLVWCNTVLSANYVRAAEHRRIPVVLHAHENAADIERLLHRYGLFHSNLANVAAGRPGLTLVGCSPQTSASLETAIGAPAGTAATLFSAIDVDTVAAVGRQPDHRRIPGGEVMIVGCGQDLVVKGADAFTRIATIVTDQRPGTRFRWVGGEPGNFPVGSPVVHIASLPSAIDALADADIVLLTSRSDRFPLVVLEAMAVGATVVAFRVGDVAEQLGDTGLLIAPGDEQAMAQAVIALLDDPAERHRLAEAARLRVAERWGLDRFDADVRRIADAALRSSIGAATPIGSVVDTDPTTDHAGTGTGTAPLRVLHLLWRLSLTGGIQVVVRNLITGLDPDRYLIDIATVRPAAPMDELDVLPPNVTVHPLGFSEHVSRMHYVRAARQFNSLIRRLRPDIIHLHTGTAWIAAAACRLGGRGIPVVIEVHDAPGHGRHGTRTEAIEGWFARRNRWWAVSHASPTQADVETAWHVPSERSVMFPLGIDTDRFRPAADCAAEAAARAAWRSRYGVSEAAVVLICVARLVPSKRIDVLIEALAQLRGTAAHLVIVGDGPSADALQRQADELDLTDDLSFVGGLPYREIPEVMAAADIAVSASAYEGFGLTVVEAMAAGLAVVATNVGGVSDLIADGTTGLLIPAANAEAFSEAVRQLIVDPDLRSRMGAAGRRRAVSSFDIANLAAGFSELYQTMQRQR